MPATEAICCPLCGWWRTIPYGIDEQGNPREVRFDKVDPSASPMWRKQQLTGAGRGSPNAKVETLDSKGLEDLPEHIKDQVREQCHRILEVLEG
jgi:hypothetical protein